MAHLQASTRIRNFVLTYLPLKQMDKTLAATESCAGASPAGPPLLPGRTSARCAADLYRCPSPAGPHHHSSPAGRAHLLARPAHISPQCSHYCSTATPIAGMRPWMNPTTASGSSSTLSGRLPLGECPSCRVSLIRIRSKQPESYNEIFVKCPNNITVSAVHLAFVLVLLLSNYCGSCHQMNAGRPNNLWLH